MLLNYFIRNMVNKSTLSEEQLNSKREFIRLLKDKAVINLYKNNFFKQHIAFWKEYNIFQLQHFGFSFDDLLKARFGEGLAEILKWSFTFYKTNEVDMWCNLFRNFLKIDKLKRNNTCYI
mgnify:CR=1 FL=1